jgi:hypothetical protein
VKDYRRYLADFFGAFFLRVDLWLGGITAIIVFGVASQAGLNDSASRTLTFGVILVAVFESGYRAYLVERVLRDEREKILRITARLGSFGANAPDPGPTKSSISAHVFWEIWVTQDVATDELGLNLIYAYDKPRWQFWWLWKRTKFPQVGIPQQGKESTQHREWIHASEFQPRRGDAVFEFCYPPGDPHWLLEFVLITGVPQGEYRVPIFLDWAEIRNRRDNPPL